MGRGNWMTSKYTLRSTSRQFYIFDDTTDELVWQGKRGSQEQYEAAQITLSDLRMVETLDEMDSQVSERTEVLA
jgi:hypothetical protein